mmetsp:Transcript_60876/g.149755  ORF Transcript_60876/g.149755 Transcript_60876/m.149755 type:complete len:209 (+) Transcript_60876:192-818(+)
MGARRRGSRCPRRRGLTRRKARGPTVTANTRSGARPRRARASRPRAARAWTAQKENGSRATPAACATRGWPTSASRRACTRSCALSALMPPSSPRRTQGPSRAAPSAAARWNRHTTPSRRARLAEACSRAAGVPRGAAAGPSQFCAARRWCSCVSSVNLVPVWSHFFSVSGFAGTLGVIFGDSYDLSVSCPSTQKDRHFISLIVLSIS